MTKKDLTTKIAVKLGLNVVDVTPIVEQMLQEIKIGVAEGETIYLRGFGTFSPKRIEARKGRDIGRNLVIDLPATIRPTFKVSKEFVKFVKEGGEG
jgi:DNA-binding protein HU-beta